jgi:hypothetical protein
MYSLGSIEFVESMLFLIYFPAGILNCPVIVASLDFFS